MSYLINMDLPALFIMSNLFGVAMMALIDQRNSTHSRCAVRVVALLVIESLAVEHLYAPRKQLALKNCVYLSTLVITAQKTQSVKETMCFALILSVESSVILETFARVMKHAKKI